MYELPKVRRAKVQRLDTNDADYIVPDSREGWVKLLGKVLKSHFYSGAGFTFSTVLIRGKGAPIRGFGGTASGPEELCWGIQEISAVLNRRAGKKLRPIDALDIMNIIGYVVVAGNVRRSAQIAIGDADDVDFLKAKRWDLGSIPKWRAMSNNSVVWDGKHELSPDFWAGYDGNGEPYGLINLDLSRRVGRLDDDMYPDPDVIGYNPCAEQPLAPYETCCLAEIFLPNIKSAEELERVAIYLYRICKHSLQLACHHADTQSIVHANNRMGIGITGYLQATEEQKGWLDGCYKKLRAFDEQYSKKHDWPTSIKLTTVKPSGTLSLLAGVTPGVHPGYSQYFIRRIRIASNSPLVDKCRAHGYPVEPVQNFDGSLDNNTMVVSFPCSYPSGTALAADTSAIEQLEHVRRLQREWSDNAVSCTVYYRPDELLDIQKWLADNFRDGCKSLSFLLHSEHGFAQAPYEEISEAEFKSLSASVTPITGVSFAEEDVESLGDCEGGACPVK